MFVVASYHCNLILKINQLYAGHSKATNLVKNGQKLEAYEN